jgi:hypothetical protein
MADVALSSSRCAFDVVDGVYRSTKMRVLTHRCDECGRLFEWGQLDLDVADAGDARAFVMTVCVGCHAERVVRRRAALWGGEGRSELEVVALVDALVEFLTDSGFPRNWHEGRRSVVGES